MKIRTALLFILPLTFFFANPIAQAQYGYQLQAPAQATNSLWGSGYWGGQQGCYANSGNSQSSGPGFSNDGMSGESSNGPGQQQGLSKKAQKQKDISQAESQKTLLEAKQERLTKKIERFFDSDISDFLLQTHLDKMNRCDDYKTYPQHQCTPSEPGGPLSKEAQALCDGKDDVPDKLKAKWSTANGGYCNANSNSSRGSVQSSICSDASLRPSDAPKYRSYSVSECAQALSDYRKNKLELDKTLAKIEKAQDEIEDMDLSSDDSSEKRKAQTEGGCEECALAGKQYQKSNRDWWSTAATVAAGLGMVWYGKKTDQNTMAQYAQAGLPYSGGSPGYPLVTAGVSTIVNGLSGNGNCSTNVASRLGLGSYGGLNGGYTYANGNSAFGYPQNYTGSLVSGGIYNSSYSQLQQQLLSYSQIPVSQQTPDQQLAVAQLQARINAMNPNNGTNYNYTYGYNNGLTNGVYYGTGLTSTGLSTIVNSGR